MAIQTTTKKESKMKNNTVQGFNSKLENLLAANCPDNATGEFRQGYLSALYVLKMCELPHAYERGIPVKRFQELVCRTIRTIENKNK